MLQTQETPTSGDGTVKNENPKQGTASKPPNPSFFREWLQQKHSLSALFEFQSLKTQWGSFRARARAIVGFQDPNPRGFSKTTPVPARGRAALQSVVVKQEVSIWSHVYDSYLHLLRLPAPLFTFYCMLAPFLVALPFTLIYSFDPEGFVPQGEELISASLLELSKNRGLPDVLFEVYLYSLSLSTMFGSSRLAARSPFCLLVSNINSLITQLMFVFLSGAVFARLSQPNQPVKIASIAIITDNFFDDETADSGPSEKKNKILMTRLVLTGPSADLIDAKLDLVYRHMMQLPGGSPFMSTHSLKLVRSEASSMRYGMLVRHVIDEESPLFNNCSQDQLMDEDANFQLTVMATERSSMQPVFAEQMFFVTDSEVIWDANFVDLLSSFKGTQKMEHAKLNMYKKDGQVYHYSGSK